MKQNFADNKYSTKECKFEFSCNLNVMNIFTCNFILNSFSNYTKVYYLIKII